MNSAGGKPGVARLGRERLRAGGPRTADAYVWAGRIGSGGAAVAAAWLIFAAFRPLPSPDPAPASALPSPPAIHEGGAPLAQRERLVEALSKENYFAQDRAMWKPPEPKQAVAEAPKAQEVASAPPAIVAPTPERPLDKPRNAFDRIALTDAKGSRQAAKLAEIQLRGVYSFGGEPTAMICMTSDPRRRAESIRVGGAFGDGEWKLLAIDERHDRVIVSRGGENFAISLYPEVAVLPPQPEPQASRPAGPRVNVQTPEQVRAALEKAGVPKEEIESLIAAALAAPDAPSTTASGGDAVAQKSDDAKAAAPADAKSAAGLQSILKVMTANPLTGGTGAGIEPPRRSRKKGAKPADTGGG